MNLSKFVQYFGLKDKPSGAERRGQPLKNVCLSNQNIGQICLNIYFLFFSFVYFFIALPYGSVCQFIFSTSYYCTDLGLQLADPALLNGLSLWNC